MYRDQCPILAGGWIWPTVADRSSGDAARDAGVLVMDASKPPNTPEIIED